MDEVTLDGIDTALEEARRRFDHEEGRRQTIDTKTSILLAIDGRGESPYSVGFA
jgi:hypothetical protein